MIEFQNITKKFGDCVSNSHINLKIQEGQIHALVGENGAGKSTLMKLLMGIETPTEGRILINGKPVEITTAKVAHAYGIGMVYQHFMLAPGLPAIEHFALNNSGVLFDQKKLISDLQELSKTLNFSIDWNQTVENLPVGVQQKIEILKLLHQGSEILIFDEPTAVLTPQEILQFCDLILKLKSQGKTIIFISHKLKEVFKVSDEITVLRSGKVAGHFKTHETTPAAIAETMVGKKLHEVSNSSTTNAKRKIVLKFEALNFDIAENEILGVAGVDGNGQTELLRAIIKENADVGFVAEDRHRYAIALGANLEENFLLGQKVKGLFLNWMNIRTYFLQQAKNFNIKFQNSKELISSLSGGNQQKLVIARELSQKKKVYVIAQPTRGVDIGSIQLIHEKILEAKAGGAAILLVSTELDELLKLSDRLFVLYRGKNMGFFSREEFNEQIIGQKMAGLE